MCLRGREAPGGAGAARRGDRRRGGELRAAPGGDPEETMKALLVVSLLALRAEAPAARHGGNPTGCAMDVRRLGAALAQLLPPVLLRVAQEVDALHAAVILSGSRITSWPLSSS